MQKHTKPKWKVVRADTNKSCMMRPNSKYSLTYNQGDIVKAREGTLGIMVFDTKKQACNFMIPWISNEGKNFKVKRVLPLGRGIRPKSVCSHVSSYLLDCFYKTPGSFTNDDDIPKGTMCYPAVEVLD